MIKGIGIDIVEIGRLNDEIRKKILSPEEDVMYTGFSSVKRKLEFLAGRFAAKEAYIKATDSKIGLTEITILNDETGNPYLNKPSHENEKVFLSISHESTYAVAQCIIEI